MTGKTLHLIDRNLAALCEKERYFAPTFQAARRMLDHAIVGNGGIVFSSGATCGPNGCSCGNPACLHRVAWRLYTGW